MNLKAVNKVLDFYNRGFYNERKNVSDEIVEMSRDRREFIKRVTIGAAGLTLGSLTSDVSNDELLISIFPQLSAK